MNIDKLLFYSLIFSIYLAAFWMVPLNFSDGEPIENVLENVLAFHVMTVVILARSFLIGYFTKELSSDKGGIT